jgi:hypothetical protein
VSLWTANFHHLIINTLVFYSIFYPNCNPNQALSVLRDERCMFFPDFAAARNLLFTCGYLSYDFLILMFLYPREDKLTSQMMWHHFMGGSGLIATILVGYSFPNLGNYAMTCEVSTFFLNYRNMYNKDELGKTFPMVNQLIFFFTFTFFRIISYPCIFVLELYCCYILYSKLSVFQLVCMAIQFANFAWMLLLNFQWYGLILRGLKKLL